MELNIKLYDHNTAGANRITPDYGVIPIDADMTIAYTESIIIDLSGNVFHRTAINNNFDEYAFLESIRVTTPITRIKLS